MSCCSRYVYHGIGVHQRMSESMAPCFPVFGTDELQLNSVGVDLPFQGKERKRKKLNVVTRMARAKVKVT